MGGKGLRAPPALLLGIFGRHLSDLANQHFTPLFGNFDIRKCVLSNSESAETVLNGGVKRPRLMVPSNHSVDGETVYIVSANLALDATFC